MLKTCLASLRAAGGKFALRRAVRGAIPVIGMASFLVMGLDSVVAKERGTIPVQLVTAVPGVLKKLSFDDPVSVIPAAAIDRLIMSGQVMGSRLALKSGVEIYFPDGFVVLAEWQTKDAAQITRMLERAPGQFGRECAGEAAAMRQFRMYRHGTDNIVLMEMMGDAVRPDALRITEVRDADFLPASGIVQKLKGRCGL